VRTDSLGRGEGEITVEPCPKNEREYSISNLNKVNFTGN
jgi:hypothetical protein